MLRRVKMSYGQTRQVQMRWKVAQKYPAQKRRRQQAALFILGCIPTYYISSLLANRLFDPIKRRKSTERDINCSRIIRLMPKCDNRFNPPLFALSNRREQNVRCIKTSSAHLRTQKFCLRANDDFSWPQAARISRAPTNRKVTNAMHIQFVSRRPSRQAL